MLPPQTRLGRYEILGLLGSGGMGEVYRARDPRLSRDVAIKVLRGGGSDRGQVERFEREARAAGGLNHHAIVSVFDVGTHEGSPYVVTELLTGQTLRRRLEAGPLALRKTLEYASEIASGLAAAHEEGIVHRDLKPENLFLTDDDRVKILDFGLAKLLRRPSLGSSWEDAKSALSTEPGTVFGTAGYMAPEQIRGERVDQRADIFALGCLLYEMLTGRRAFPRGNPVETMNAILNDEAAEMGPTVPPGIEHLVRRCLEKRPEDRLQSVRDVDIALDAVSTESGRVLAPPAAGRRLWRGGALAVAALALGAALGFVLRPPATRPVTLERLTYRRGNITGARFAPDGQTIFFSAAWEGQPTEVFSTLPGAMQGRALGLVGWDVAALSPQGELALSRRPPNVRSLRFLGTLARVPATGGVPRDVLQDVWSSDWSRDGTALAVVREGQPRRIELPIGHVVATSEGHPRMLRVSPDGRAVAFVEIGRSDHSDRIVVADLSGSVRKLAADLDVLGLAWAPDGREVWYSATPGVLAAVNRDGRRRTLAQLAGNLVLHDVARDGRTALVSHVSDRASLVWSPAEGPERDLSWLEGSYVAALGTRHVLFSEWLEGGGRQGSVVLRSLDGAPAVRLGDGDAQDLSPDGRWALARTRSERREHVLLPTGLGTARVLPHHDLVSTAEPAQWAPDGRHILFSAVAASGGPPTSFVQNVGDGGIRPLTPRGVTVSGPVSPRGLVYSPVQHALYPLAGGEPRPLPQRPPGALEVVGWSEDGSVAYVLETNVPVPACVMTLDLATGRTALHREFAPRDLAGITRVYPLKLGPDRRSWAYSAYRMLSDLYLLRLP